MPCDRPDALAPPTSLASQAAWEELFQSPVECSCSASAGGSQTSSPSSSSHGLRSQSRRSTRASCTTAASEEQLELQPHELLDFVENGTMSMHWVGPDGKILWANRDELNTLGYKAHEYIGKPITDFHVDQATIEDILRRLTDGETLRDYLARMRHKDGSIVHVSINSSTYRDSEGKFIHTRCFTSNVTARKLAEMEEKERVTSELNQRLELLNTKLQREAEMNLALLHQMMPAKVASDLTMGRKVPPEAFANVTIFFSDIEGFTKIAAAVEPPEVIHLLNVLYTAMDHCAAALPVYKVETIGDAYMVVGGLPERSGRHAPAVADFALLVREAVRLVPNPLKPDVPVRLRMGLHSGPVIAGVVGNLMPRYCLFGDTVNTASRMESTGEAGRIQCSGQLARELQRCGGYEVRCRGPVEVKGKGSMTTYWLEGGAETGRQCWAAFVERMLGEIRELLALVPSQNSYQNLVRDWQIVD